MFRRLARFVVYNPWKVIAAWVVATVAIVGLAPSLSQVINRDQTEFLPSRYESVQATNLAKSAFGSANQASAAIVLKRSAGGELTEADQAKAGEIAQRLRSAGIERVTGVVT